MSTLFEQFVAFARSKPADEEFNMLDTQNCAVAQFAKSIDPRFVAAGFTWWVSNNAGMKARTVWNDTNVAKMLRVFDEWPRTWGELLDAMKLVELID